MLKHSIKLHFTTAIVCTVNFFTTDHILITLIVIPVEPIPQLRIYLGIKFVFPNHKYPTSDCNAVMIHVQHLMCDTLVIILDIPHNILLYARDQ